MAAETLTATRAAPGFPRAAHGGGILNCAYGTITVSANVEDGDIFEMCLLPAGATVVGGWFYCDDLDTGAEALDMNVGWAANGGSGTYDSSNPTGFGNLGTLTGDPFAAGNVAVTAGLIYPFGGVLGNGDLPTFTEPTTIQVEANTAATTLTAGNLSVVVYYVVA